MSETTELIGIYGEIDRAVALNPALVDEVARVLPAYQDLEEPWFDHFVDWTRRRTGAEPEFPRLEEALVNLKELPPPPPRMHARRLFAIGAAAHTFPDAFDVGGEFRQPAIEALKVEGVTADDPQAERVLDHLRNRELLSLPDDPWWAAVVNEASPARDLGPRPCSGRLLTVPLPGGAGPVATLRARFTTDKVTFADAISFLEPSHWPECSDFWCSMDKLPSPGPTVHRYHEIVSTNCARREYSWTISADLDFGFVLRPDVIAITRYRLTDDKPQDEVLIDEGSLTVRQLGQGALEVTTTKRIKFAESFSGEALALMMCAMGYAYVVEDLVFSCAQVRGASGHRFPGNLQAAAPGTAQAGTGCAGLVDEYAIAVKAFIDEYAIAAKASYKKMEDGGYGIEEAVQDAAQMSSRALRDGAKLVETGSRLLARKPKET